MAVKTYLVKVAEGLTFTKIAQALNCANIGTYIQEEFDKFLLDRRLNEVPTVPMATHSMGDRDWHIEEGREPAFFAEPCFNGGWHVFREEDVSYLFASSATSGSSLTAEKVDDGWTLTLSVPVENDAPYQGWYWGKFHEVVNAD